MLCFRKRNMDKDTSSNARVDQKSASEILLRYAVFFRCLLLKNMYSYGDLLSLALWYTHTRAFLVFHTVVVQGSSASELPSWGKGVTPIVWAVRDVSLFGSRFLTGTEIIGVDFLSGLGFLGVMF